MQPFDCELISAGLVAQPVNTVSSLFFVVVAIALWRTAWRLESVAIFLAGVGSIWFHAAPSSAGEWLHDIGLYAAIAVAALAVWQRLSDGEPPVLAFGVFGTGAMVWFFSRSDGPLCDPGSLLQGHAVWHGLAAVAFWLLYTRRRARTSPVSNS